MSLPDELQTGKNICNANDYYTTELGTSPWYNSESWLFTDLDNSSIDPLRLYTPPINLSEKPLDVFGGQPGDPFGTGSALPIPDTISGADLTLNLAPQAPAGNITQPSTNTSSSDDSLLLGSGEADSSGDLLSEPFTTPDDSDLFQKPTYKPGWATANGSRESESTSSSTPQSKKRGKSNTSPVKARRTSPRSLSLTTRYETNVKEEPEEPSSPETAGPNASKSKRSHNLTEKKYRTRLNGYFETLLSVIPKPSGTGDAAGATAEAPEKKISKGEVLVLAMEYIRTLERDQGELEQQRRTLSSDMEHLKDVSTGMDGETMVY
jgi:hypothetical protein